MASGARSIWTRRQTDVVCLAFLLLTVGAFIAVLGLSDTCTVPTLEANQTYSANTSENASSAMPSAENTSSVVCSVSMSPLGVDPSAASIIFSYAVPAAVSATQILLTFAATKSLAAWRRRLAILVTPIAPVVTFMWVRGSTFTSPAVTHLCTLAVCAYVAIWWYSSRKISRISAAICAETTRLVSLPHQLLLGTMSAALQAPLVVVSLAALGDVVTTGDLSRLSSPRLVGLILLPLVLASFVHQLASHVTAVLVYGRFFFSNGPDEEAQPLSLPRAIAMICRYHLGSVFFAALVQQVASSLRRLAASTERELASTQRENFAAKLFVKLVHCCLLYPVKKFVKFISCYATVVVASQGNTFCHAGYRTFFFFLQNPGQVAIQEKVSTEIEYITSLVLAVACTLVYAAAEAQTSPLASTYATGGVFLVSYTIFRAYTSQMNMAVLATFCCCFQDKAEFGGKHMSERLATAFGMKRRGDGRSLEDDLDDQAENDNEQGGGGWRFGGGALGSQAKKAKKMKVKSGWQMSNPVAPSAEPTALSTGSSSPLKVSFWFVKADKVREAARDKDTAVLSALTQNHQSLKQMAPQLLVRQDIDKRKAFSGAYKDTYVSVSHRCVPPGATLPRARARLLCCQHAPMPMMSSRGGCEPSLLPSLPHELLCSRSDGASRPQP